MLLREGELDRATTALQGAGFHRDSVMDVTVFLDGPDGKPGQGVHVIRAGKKVKANYVNPAPEPNQSQTINGKQIIDLADLAELVQMKLNSNRDKGRTHLRDMIGVGLIDATWPSRFASPLDQRLQGLLDDPDG